MKKFYSILTMLMIFMGMQAQDLSSGQMWWGYYSNQQTALVGNSQLGLYEVAMFVPGDGDLSGVNIAGARMQTRLYSNAKDVKLWIRSSLDGENLAEKTITNPASSGWTSATFDAPVSLPSSGVYVGYSFNLASWYSDYDYTPVVTGKKVVSGGLYLKQPNEETFTDKSAKGCATTQLIISGSALKSNAVSLADDIDNMVGLKGAPVNVKINVTNLGTAGVKDIDYTYTLDGGTHTGHIDLTTPIGQVYNDQQSFNIELGSASQLGPQTCELQITKVNGQANQNPSEKKTKASFDIVILKESAPRTSVAEIYIGPSQQYSFRGLVGAEQLAKSLGDKIIPVIAQSYNSPLVTPEYKAYEQYADGSLRFTTYPKAEINREFVTDPYYGNATASPYHFTADKLVEPTLNVVTEGTITAKASWTDESKTSVSISAAANFTGDFLRAPYRMGFIVIADGFVQDLTNYACYYKTQYPDDDMSVWTQGTYSMKGVEINNMVVSSTDMNGVAKSINATIAGGHDYKFDYELPINQFEGQSPKNFRVVALLLNNDTKTIVNASVTPVEGVSAIQNISTSKGENTIYNLNGVRVEKPSKGIFIVNGKKMVIK